MTKMTTGVIEEQPSHKPLIHAALVHGFNVRDGGEGTVDRLEPYMKEAGWDVNKDEADYGYYSLFMIKWAKSKKRSQVLYRLAKAFEKANVIVTHSNGAHFTTQALNMLGPEFNNTKVVIHISPALDRDTPIPLAVKAQMVLCTPHDFWVRLSSYIPFFPWGRMGAFGYSGEDNRNLNEMHKEVREHSDWFKEKYSYDPTWLTTQDFAEKHI